MQQRPSRQVSNFTHNSQCPNYADLYTELIEGGTEIRQTDSIPPTDMLAADVRPELSQCFRKVQKDPNK